MNYIALTLYTLILGSFVSLLTKPEYRKIACAAFITTSFTAIICPIIHILKTGNIFSGILFYIPMEINNFSVIFTIAIAVLTLVSALTLKTPIKASESLLLMLFFALSYTSIFIGLNFAAIPALLLLTIITIFSAIKHYSIVKLLCINISVPIIYYAIVLTVALNA